MPARLPVTGAQGPSGWAAALSGTPTVVVVVVGPAAIDVVVLVASGGTKPINCLVG
jgi:hypothetical protein